MNGRGFTGDRRRDEVRLCRLALGLLLVATAGGCTHQRAPQGAKDGGCTVDGKYHAVGDTYPATDGCNTCTCQAGGRSSCTKKPCTPTDRACRKTGCSGEICADEDVISICEYRPEHACYKTAVCTRQGDGRCGFTMTPELHHCLQEAR